MPLVPSSIRRACVMATFALLAATHAAAHAGSVAFWRITLTAAGARSEILLSQDDVRRMVPGNPAIATRGPVDMSRLTGFDAVLLTHFAIEQDGAVLAAHVLAPVSFPPDCSRSTSSMGQSTRPASSPHVRLSTPLPTIPTA